MDFNENHFLSIHFLEVQKDNQLKVGYNELEVGGVQLKSFRINTFSDVQKDNQLKVGYNELTVGGFQLKSFIFRFQGTII